MNNDFSNNKIQFYDKIGNKYYHALLKYKKKYPDNKDFKKNVINWLFSNDEETRMILCSIENKKYTNYIKEAYNLYDKSRCYKFYIKVNEDETKTKLFNYNNSKLVSNKSHDYDYYFKEMSLFNDIKFYQCESSINDYNRYSSYFTFVNMLKNNVNFLNICDYYSNNEFLENPIEFVTDSNKYLEFPCWIYKYNIPDESELFKFQVNGINISLYYTLPKLILALLEQVLCVRYILFYDTNNLDQILSSIYLYEIFQKRNSIIKYLTPKTKKFSYIYFKIDDLATNLYNDQNLKEFIDKYSIKEKAIFGVDNIEIYFHKEDDLNSIILEGNTFFNNLLKNNTQKDFINFFLFLNIKQLFTYDDFYFRGIFEKIYENYSNQNIKDLILEDEQKKDKEKTKKKKKRKKIENNYDDKLNNKIINNQKENEKQIDFGDEVLKILSEANISGNNDEKKIDNQDKCNTKNIQNKEEDNNKNKINFICDEEKNLIKTYIKNLIFESLFNKIKLLEYQESIILKNEKRKNKRKEFFLYDTSGNNKKKKKNKQNDENSEKLNKIESAEKIEKNAEENNILNMNQINKLKETITSHIDSLSFISKNSESSKKSNSTNNNSFINHGENLCYDDQYQLMTSQKFKLLNNNILEYYNILEEALVIQRKIKLELVNYFSSIIKIVYKNSNILIYGSSLYNLDIDTSDLDLSISSKENITLSNLELYLKENNKKNQYSKLNGIFSASVPIIKLEIDYLKIENDNIRKLYELLKNTNYYQKYYNSDKENENYMNKINIDISLNSFNHKQIEFINSSLSEYPEMKPLIKIIKKILQLKNMNNSYLGGMSSYCLFLLIYSYFKFYYKKIENNKIENKEINYGLLLIEILSFYTNYIDFNYTIIDPNSDIPFINEYHLETIPTIIEPISKQNAAKTIYKIYDVVECLHQVYQDIFRILETNTGNNLIFELMEEYSKNMF